MPDIANLTVTVGTAASISAQRFTIECQVLDSDTGGVLADFTGANALQWPNVLASLTGAQRRAMIEAIMFRIIRQRAGLDA